MARYFKTLLSSITILVTFFAVYYPSDAMEHPLDWNDKNIQWHNYEEGLEFSRKSGKPVILIFYAEWCTTCHAYKNIFNDKTILDMTKDFIMVRVDSDKYPVLNMKFAFDGEYIPRTFAISSNGRVMHEIYPDENYKYYISADEPSRFIELMKIAYKMENQSQPPILLLR